MKYYLIHCFSEKFGLCKFRHCAKNMQEAEKIARETYKNPITIEEVYSFDEEEEDQISN